MAWTNYREIVDRFNHIDAEFVQATTMVSPDGGHAEVVVRFYPWWEHPLFVAASDRGDEWGFVSRTDGMRDVRVRAIEPWAVRLSPRREVTDWRFEEQHPLLWDFAERSTVYPNAPFDGRAFIDALIALELPNVSERDIVSHLDLRATSKAPFGMTIPAQLHDPVLTVFRRLGIPVFSPGSPSVPPPAVVFLVDDDDHIIARDFEVEVPEFIHEAEWFQPGRSRGTE